MRHEQLREGFSNQIPIQLGSAKKKDPESYSSSILSSLKEVALGPTL